MEKKKKNVKGSLSAFVVLKINLDILKPKKSQTKPVRAMYSVMQSDWNRFYGDVVLDS